MMILAEATLGRYSLGRYEVANYAEGREHESRHNTAYWTGSQYIGVGPGAHGMLDAQTALTVGLARVRRRAGRAGALRQRPRHRGVAGRSGRLC